MRLLSEHTGETDAVYGAKRVHHGADGFEAAGDEGFGFGEGGGYGTGEFEEEGFAFAGAVALMFEAEFFVGTAAEFDEVEAVGFEPGAEVAAFDGIEAALLEFDTVEFDPEDKRRGDMVMDFAGDVKDDAGSVLEVTAVFICTFVCGWREELGKEVATS